MTAAMHSNPQPTPRRRVSTRSLRAALWGLVAAGSFASAAAAQEYLVSTYSESDGLPSSTVNGLDQDSHGRMWFATRSGVARYDGLTWRKFTFPETPAKAYDQLRIDATDQVWALAQRPDATLARYDGTKWHAIPALDARLGSATTVTSMAVQGGGEGAQVALGSLDAGLLLWADGEWHQLDRASGLPSDAVYAVEATPEGFYLATGDGVLILHPDRRLETPEWAAKLPRGPVLGLAVGHHQAGAPAEAPSIWLAGTDWLASRTAARLEIKARATPLLELPLPVQIEPDGRGGAFFGRSSNLFYLRADGRQHSLGRRNGLIADGVTAMLLDRERLLWVAGPRGVSKVVSMRFANYRSEHGLLDDEVSAIAELPDGRLVFGHNLGLSLFDGERFEHRPFPLGGLHPSLVRTLDLSVDPQGALWIAASNLGLGRLGPRGEIRWYRSDEGLDGSITAVTTDAAGRLWVAGTKGLFVAAGDGFRQVQEAALRDTGIRRLHAADAGLLVGTMGAGVSIQRGGEWRRVEVSGDRFVNDTYAVYHDRGGRTWVGTLGGLFELSSGDLRRPDEAELAIHRPVYFITEDSEGVLWLGTDNGVLLWDRGGLRQLSVQEGLAGSETNRAAGFVSKSGAVWIGTDGGVSLYQRELDPGPAPAPLVAIQGLETSKRGLALSGPLRLTPQERDLSFRVLVTSMVDERAVTLDTYLSGYDPTWAGPEPYGGQLLRYTSLQPGEYQLHVRARHVDGGWSDTVSSPIITIAAPFWALGWFRLAVGLSALGLFYLIVSAFHQRRNSARLEAMVQERTAELQASQERFRTLFAQSPDAVMLLDAESLMPLEYNEAVLRMIGFPGELFAHLPVAAFDGSSGGGLDRRLRRIAPGEETRFEAQLRRRDGELRQARVSARRLEMSGRPVLQTIFHDVTESKRAEEALRRSEQRFRTLATSLPAVVFICRGTHILYVTRQIEELLGYTPEEIEQGDLLQLAHPATASIIRSRLEAVERGEGAPRFEAQLVRKDGEARWMDLSTRVIDDAGEPAILAIAFDITEQRQREAQLREAQRMQLVGRLTGGVAHEFNNLFTVILGSLELLRGDVGTEPNVGRLGAARDAVARGANLTAQLLAFSRQLVLRPRQVDLGNFLPTFVRRLQAHLPSNLRVVTSLDAQVGMVWVDPEELETALLNLVLNAQAAMPEGGRLTVHAEGVVVHDDRATAGCRPGQYVKLTVRDTGSGIPDDIMPRVFEPFFTTREVGEGSGLGLSMVYGFAHQSGGSVSIESTVGEGTAVSLILPTAADDEELESAPAPTPSPEGATAAAE